MLTTGFYLDGPAAVRYPRGKGPGIEVEPTLETLPVGKAEVRRRGEGLAILAFGTMVTPAEAIAGELNATVVNMRFVKPLDTELILRMAADHERLVTVEENSIIGGAGSAVDELLAAADVRIPVLNLGLPDRYVDHGSREQLLTLCGLDESGIAARIQQWIG
jgi:1-deoxy-D-xylulose-5-phosphate synthase